MADETTKSEADETTDDQVEATADKATGDENAQGEQSGEAAETAAEEETEGAEEAADESEDQGEDTESKAEESDKDETEADVAAETETSDDGKVTEDKAESKSEDDEPAKSEEETDEYGGISMDQVEAILKRNAGDAKVDDDDLNITPQMRRMFDRELENTKRVEETIKGAKSNPVWLVPVFVALLIIGLIWVVAFYFTGKYPIPNIGQWNLLVGFAIMLVGFLMTMWWH